MTNAPIVINFGIKIKDIPVSNTRIILNCLNILDVNWGSSTQAQTYKTALNVIFIMKIKILIYF